MAPLKIVSSQDALRRVQRPVVTAAAEPKPEDFELRAAQAWTRAASMGLFFTDLSSKSLSCRGGDWAQ